MREPRWLQCGASSPVSGLWIGDEDSSDFAAVGGRAHGDPGQLLGSRRAGRNPYHGCGRTHRAGHLRGLAIDDSDDHGQRGVEPLADVAAIGDSDMQMARSFRDDSGRGASHAVLSVAVAVVPSCRPRIRAVGIL